MFDYWRSQLTNPRGIYLFIYLFIYYYNNVIAIIIISIVMKMNVLILRICLLLYAPLSTAVIAL